MRSIAIYVEGGGDTAQQRGELRFGFEQLLRVEKEGARAKRLGWKLVFCGGRVETWNTFANAVRFGSPADLRVLLVDAEDLQPGSARSAQDRKAHLERRDGWELRGTPAESIHLMVQCMEAWIAADAEALESFYQRGFKKRALPARLDLEQEPRKDLYAKLESATKGTSKGAYAKIGHAGRLLALLDAKKVAARCPHFHIFCAWLAEQIRRA